ncbi:response regulator [Paenibacillus cymbidii]|uniref:response regulator n=1 Tax=Paenibacillus cymbidii TaxID=1639034 RepID=UPI0010821DAC|nr:response regulator transcription factor [Paenibacillus cymbidii]
MMKPIRVLAVDDHADAREAIRYILESDPAFELIAEGRNGLEAIELTAVHMPDLVLMDINMPGMDGLEATKRIKERFPHVKIVVLTVSDDIVSLFEALKQGAQGYLLKHVQMSSWHDYLKAVAVDEAPMSRELANRILQEFAAREQDGGDADRQRDAAAADKAPASDGAPLTSRERELLTWVARGHSNREIAEALFISEHTVKNHLKNILHKLQLANRVQLTRYAYERGWIKE